MAKVKKIEITVNQARAAISALHEAAEYHNHCAMSHTVTHLESGGGKYAKEVTTVVNKKLYKMWKKSEKEYLKLKRSLIKRVKKAEEVEENG